MQTYPAVNRFVEFQLAMDKVKTKRNMVTKNGETFEILSEEEQSAEVTWSMIPWRKIEKDVFKLQKKIYKASADNDICKMRKYQKMLLRSYKAKLLAVRRVTQDNKGKKTAGIDGIKSVIASQRFTLVESLKLSHKAKATRRVWIPKSNGEKRPLGIPTMYDRALQALVKMALEPEWEAKFEPNSYGFRPARRCQDAIQQIKLSIQHKPKFVLDADIAKCFERIDHQKLLTKTGLKGNLRKQVKAWLTSGVMEDGVFQKIESGTPQGGVISPLLANIALHGMETIVRECVNKNQTAQKELNFIRYADDFVVMHKDKKIILKCKEAINQWLSDIGLELKPEKTRLTHTLYPELSEDKVAGFDFLGFHIQQHKTGKHKCSKNLQKKLTGYKTLITPSEKSQKNHQEKLGEIIGKLVSKPIEALIKQLNPVIKGWSNYYQYSDIKTAGISSKQTKMMYSKLRSWAKRSCGTVNDGLNRYYHKRKYIMLNGKESYRMEWADSVKAIGHIAYHGDIHCSSTEYVKVKRNKSPYDGDLKYWYKRLLIHPELSTRKLNLLKRQKGRCQECGLYFTESDIMEVDHIIPLSLGGLDRYDNLQLLHGHCHDSKTATDGSCTKKSEKIDSSNNKHTNKDKAKIKSYKPDKLDLIAIERNSPVLRDKKSQRQDRLIE